MDLVGKVMFQFFNMLFRLVLSFLPRSKHLFISWLQSPSAVVLEPKKIKSVTVSTVFPSICHEVMGLDAMILVFSMLSFTPAFSLSSFNSSRSSLVPPHFLPWGSDICISEAIDISPSSLDSSLCFIQPIISQHVLCIELNKQGDNIQPWHTPWNHSIVSCLVLTVASWPSYRFLRSEVRWSGIPSL